MKLLALLAIIAGVAHLLSRTRRHNPRLFVGQAPSRHCERSVYQRNDWWRIQRTVREVK